jgi:hypothetical protein
VNNLVHAHRAVESGSVPISGLRTLPKDFNPHEGIGAKRIHPVR